MKNSRKTPSSTGGTPVKTMNGVAMERSQIGARGQAATAPRRFPRMKETMVVTSSSVIVQGRASLINCRVVRGYRYRETPRSNRAMAEM